MGLVSIIFWALLFTMMIKSCTSSYANMGTVEVPYTTFKEWLAEDKIDTVNVENGKYTFTLRDGVEVELPREETSGGSGSLMNSLIPVPAQTEEEKQYITVPWPGWTTRSCWPCWRSTPITPTPSRWTSRPISSA